MPKFKFRPTRETTIEEVTEELNRLAHLDVPEIPFDYVCKIANYIGVELLKSKGGSARRFRHVALIGFDYYTEGIFKVDIIHKGKSNPQIRTWDFRKYLFPPLMHIIESLKEEGEKT